MMLLPSQVGYVNQVDIESGGASTSDRPLWLIVQNSSNDSELHISYDDGVTWEKNGDWDGNLPYLPAGGYQPMMITDSGIALPGSSTLDLIKANLTTTYNKSVSNNLSGVLYRDNMIALQAYSGPRTLRGVHYQGSSFTREIFATSYDFGVNASGPRKACPISKEGDHFDCGGFFTITCVTSYNTLLAHTPAGVSPIGTMGFDTNGAGFNHEDAILLVCGSTNIFIPYSMATLTGSQYTVTDVANVTYHQPSYNSELNKFITLGVVTSGADSGKICLAIADNAGVKEDVNVITSDYETAGNLQMGMGGQGIISPGRYTLIPYRKASTGKLHIILTEDGNTVSEATFSARPDVPVSGSLGIARGYV